MNEAIPNLQHHNIVLDDFRLHVVTAGADDAPPVLLLHCWTGNWQEFERVLGELAPNFRCMVPDQLGFGQSEKPRGDHYGIHQQAFRARQVLEHFGYAEATVIGHSMGGQIALTVAGLYPKLVTRLVVLAPAVTGKMHPWTWPGAVLMYPVRYGITAPINLAQRVGKRFPVLGVPFVRTYFPRPRERWDDAAYWANQTTADGQVHSAALAEKAIRQWDVTPLLSDITAPTLAIWGEQDYSVPISELNVLTAHIPDIHTVRIPAVGHFPLVEAWEPTIHALTAFVQPTSAP